MSAQLRLLDEVEAPVPAPAPAQRQAVVPAAPEFAAVVARWAWEHAELSTDQGCRYPVADGRCGGDAVGTCVVCDEPVCADHAQGVGHTLPTRRAVL